MINLEVGKKYTLYLEDGEIVQGEIEGTDEGMWRYEIYEVYTTDKKTRFIREDRIKKAEVIL